MSTHRGQAPLRAISEHTGISGSQAGRRRSGELECGPEAALRFGSGFVFGHVWLPMAGFLVLVAASTLGRGDQWLAGLIYGWGGREWVLRDSFLVEQLAHLVGRQLSVFGWLLVVAAWGVACLRPGWAGLRRPLACLLVSVLLSTLVVAWIKSWSNMDCPWDLASYGGTRPYVGLFAVRPIGLERGVCFPAGHASGGYAWLALYFFLAAAWPRWRLIGLATGLGLGLVFGFSQQLRGAHFFSHDLVTAGICWAVALLVHWLAGAGPRSPTRSRLGEGPA